MKAIAFLILFSAFSALAAGSNPAGAKPAKSRFNTQIYEQENDQETFEATVKVVREIQGDSEVFFEGRQGFYTVTSGDAQANLVESQKRKLPVKVTVDNNSRQILKAEFFAKPSH